MKFFYYRLDYKRVKIYEYGNKKNYLLNWN